jgi:hypothetical protein
MASLWWLWFLSYLIAHVPDLYYSACDYLSFHIWYIQTSVQHIDNPGPQKVSAHKIYVHSSDIYKSSKISSSRISTVSHGGVIFLSAILTNARFEVFTAVIMKNAVFWDVAACTSCVNRRFGGTYRLHLQGRKIRERETSVSRWLQTECQSKTTSYIRTEREGEWAIWEINSDLLGQFPPSRPSLSPPPPDTLLYRLWPAACSTTFPSPSLLTIKIFLWITSRKTIFSGKWWLFE